VESSVQLTIGEPAPDFSLEASYPARVKLHEYRGQNVMIAFYPLDFSGG
jgi:peroxiredoxin